MRLARTLIAILVLLPGSVLPVLAMDEEQTFPMAQTAMSELLVGIGTRSTAMGGASAAASNDLDSLYWNPAGLHWLKNYQIEFTHNAWIQDSSQENLLFGMPLAPGIVLAAGGSYLGLGSIDETGTKPDGSILLLNQTLNLSAYGATVGISAGLSNAWAVGGAIEYFQENLGPVSPATAAVNLGVQYQSSESLSCGAALENFGLGVSGYDIPAGMRVGAAYQLPVGEAQHLVAAADAEFLLTAIGQSRYHVGLEYEYQSTLSIRCGYQMADTTATGLTGLTAGFGVRLAGWQLGYTIAPMGDLGLSHRLSLGFEFGDKTDGEPVTKSGG